MAIIFLQGSPTRSFFKLFTLSLPFFCLLLTWGASSTTTLPQPSAAAAAALHSSGYSLFATVLTAATASNSFNATGTILAPPDFAFSFSAPKFNNHHRRTPPRPSTSLLLYHTIKEPLTWQNLHSRDQGNELPTLYNHHCLFLSKTSNGELSFAGSRKSISAIKVRHPDLYVDDHLTVHGIDGVLDLDSASKCSVSKPTAGIKLQMDRSLLDPAVRALKRKGFSIVATAMAIKCYDLLYLNSVTVFAPSDEKLFSLPDGFRYDFRHHVVPIRLRFADIANLASETKFETLDPEKTIVIGYVNGNVTINSAKIYCTEIYLNRWISVISVSRTFDDERDNEANSQILYPGIAVQSTAPTYSGNSVPIAAPSYAGIAVQSTASSYSGNAVPSVAPTYSGIAVPSTAPTHSGIAVPSTAPTYSSNAVPSTAPTYSGNLVPIAAPSYAGIVVQSTAASYSGNTVPSVAPTYSGIAVPSTAPTYSGNAVPLAAPSYSSIAVQSTAPSYSGNTVPSAAPIYSGNTVPSAAPSYSVNAVPSAAPSYSGDAVPSAAPSFSGDFEGSSTATKSHDFGIEEMLDKVRSSSFSDGSEITAGVPVPSRYGITDCTPANRDGVISVVAVEGEGGEVLCLATAPPPRSKESEALINVDAVKLSPSDAYNVSNEVALISAVDDAWE